MPGWISTVLPSTGTRHEVGGRSRVLIRLQSEVHRDTAQVFGVGAAIRRRARVVDEVTRAVGVTRNSRLIRGGVDAVAGVGRRDGVAIRIASPFGRMPEVDIERRKRQAGDPGHAADSWREQIAQRVRARAPFQAWDEHSVHRIDDAQPTVVSDRHEHPRQAAAVEVPRRCRQPLKPGGPNGLKLRHEVCKRCQGRLEVRCVGGYFSTCEDRDELAV